MTRMYFALAAIAITATAAYAKKPQAELNPVSLHHGDRSGAVQKACTVGFRNLKAFFDANGLPFDPAVVSSHKGLYCHLYYEPTIKGFRASATQDPLQAVLFDATANAAISWAKARFESERRSVPLTPVPPSAVADADWQSAFVEGWADEHPTLLHAKTDEPAPATDLLPARVQTSRLPWDARDFVVIRPSGGKGRTMLLYGDRLRGKWHGLLEEERAYLLRVEFGVDAALHLATGHLELSELLIVDQAGVLSLSRAVPSHDASRLRHQLEKAGLTLSHADGAAMSADAMVIPERVILLRAAVR